MAIDLNDEIVQDFLVEAGEILELLNEQVVDLETSPEDSELLNAVFRGFHTIKGGAGFLAMDSLVHVAHKCEDMFDLLRQGKRTIDANLMDIVLNVLDVLNDMFDEIREGQDPSPASSKLMAKLTILADPNGVLRTIDGAGKEKSSAIKEDGRPDEIVETDLNSTVETESEKGLITEVGVKEGDITEDEFEALLDELHGANRSPGEANMAASGGQDLIAEITSKDGDISEDEFEQLLDALHGSAAPTNIEPPSEPSSITEIAAKEGDITEEEFDQLLDELQAKKQIIESTSETESEKVKPEAAVAKEESKATVKKAVQAKDSETKSKQQSNQETTVRVETKTLDSIMNLVGELVLIRNRLSNLEVTIGDENLSKTTGSLDVITSNLQSVVLKTRMQPIRKVFGKFPRVVRDLARSLGREINLEMHGVDTDLDKNLVEALADPLVHLVRNAVDHGIEMPHIREANGKERQGNLELGAMQEGDHVLITISDDGAGMDPDVLRNKAVEKGMMDEETAARLEDRECFDLIFSAGFSTKVEVSDVSGRGVGMDVVKTRISQLNGTVEIDSKLGEGTTLSIKLPLTLAIMPTLMIKLSKQIFALPLVNVKEIIGFNKREINVVGGQNALVVRGRAIPIFNLSSWLVEKVGTESKEKDPEQVVIIKVGTQAIGLLVDDLIGQEEVIIKPLDSKLQGVKGLAGATITGDGRIALILDLPSLIGHYTSL